MGAVALVRYKYYSRVCCCCAVSCGVCLVLCVVCCVCVCVLIPERVRHALSRRLQLLKLSTCSGGLPTFARCVLPATRHAVPVSAAQNALAVRPLFSPHFPYVSKASGTMCMTGVSGGGLWSLSFSFSAARIALSSCGCPIWFSFLAFAHSRRER